MARPGITYTAVACAATQLTAQQIRPNFPYPKYLKAAADNAKQVSI